MTPGQTDFRQTDFRPDLVFGRRRVCAAGPGGTGRAGFGPWGTLRSVGHFALRLWVATQLPELRTLGQICAH
ncbi:hypothetical protein AAFF_G00264920 [Aldrovandia affinis]|uniref:Uncharacterized protein n=1 Tax=Aldrovandia affinis TaxID=143900 RepID=A0AAD7RED3_9TELE|nr:hypothetical protein AAFF_G00264920 [Aldrovandia affinis]